MAQMTDSLARAILRGDGYTRHEVEQLCHRWLSQSQQEAPGAVAPYGWVHEPSSHVYWRADNPLVAEGKCRAVYTTPPAPVDVRVVDAAMLRRALNATFNGVSMYDALQCGTDWNHEILEAALTAALLVGEKP